MALKTDMKTSNPTTCMLDPIPTRQLKNVYSESQNLLSILLIKSFL